MKAFFTLFFISLFSFSQAQTSKLIIVADNASNATVVITKASDSSVVFKATYKNNLELDLPSNTDYLLTFTAIGKTKIERLVSLKESTLTVNVALTNIASKLDAIVITAKKPLITREDDKEIINAEVLANSSSNAFEVLEKTPGAIIDQDGNVYLSSTTPATVYINGREMKLSASDIASLLKSLPANSILKIEVLRTPSAKYDASGSGGIVNIVLKKGVKIGFNGSVNISSFQGVKNTSSIGVSANKSEGKWNSYGSYQYTNSNNFERLRSERKITSNASAVLQNSYTTYPTQSHFVGGGTDYQFTKKLNITYDASMNYSDGNSATENTNELLQVSTGAGSIKTNSLINNGNKSFYFSNALSGKYKIDSAGSELTADISYNIFNADNSQGYNTFLFPNNITQVKGDGIINNDKNIFAATLDLTYKLPYKITLETGLKFTGSNSENDANYFVERQGEQRKVDSFQTNRFKYDEKISATYLQVAKTFHGFTLKPGLRLETTNINGNQIVPKDTSFSIKRTDLFPYVYLSRNLFKLFKQELVGNVIYRRSIRRPFYENLNPYLRYIDQYLYETGNPNLKPQFTTNYEANVTFDNIPVLSFGKNETIDIFSNVTYQDDSTKIAFQTYDNLGKNTELYFRFIAGIPPGGKYFFYVGGRYNQNIYDGLYQNKPLKYTYDGWTFFMYQELKLTPSFNINVQGYMRTRGLQNFYEVGANGGIFASANKTILDKKGTITLSIRDPFYTNPVNFSLNQGNISATGRRENDSRRIGIKFRYNFGFTPKKKVDDGFSMPAVDGQ